MSQRRLAFPTTPEQSLKPERLSRSDFSGGMNADDPASELQANELAKLINLIAYDKYMEGRTGCQELINYPLPALQIMGAYGPEDALFTASKIGTEATVGEVDPPFATLVRNGDYFLWPTEGLLDQVASHVEGAFTSLISGDIAEEDGCKIIGQPFGAYYHDKNKTLYIHLGTDLWQIDNAFTEYKKVLLVGTVGLSRTRSRFRPQDENIIVFNGSRIFKIVTGEPEAHYFPINADVPGRLIDEVAQDDAKQNGRQYIYAMARIVGGNFNEDRFGEGNLLLQETGPCAANPHTGRDTAKVYTALPVGTGKETKDVLTSKDSAGDHCQDNYVLWAAITDFAFKISMNSAVKNIRGDMTGAANMFDVADRIQSALRSSFPSATCEYKISALGNPTLIITPGETGTIDDLNGTTGTYVDSPDAGTDITSGLTNYLKMSLDEGVLTTVLAREPVSLSALTTEDDSDHLTHFALYGSKNLKNSSTFSEKLIWIKDVPIIRPVSSAQSLDWSSSALLAPADAPIYKDDEGSVIRFFDGSEVVIEQITDEMGSPSYEETSVHALAKTSIPPEEETAGPAAIGALKVARASQVDYGDYGKVTLENTDAGLSHGVISDGIYEFAEADVGRQLFVSDGTLRTIIAIINGTEALVAETGEFSSITVAWDFKGDDFDCRNVVDTITDEILESRGGRQGADDYLLQTRFYIPLPSGSIGDVANTFIFVAPDNSNTYHYSATPLGQKHRGGYYHPGYQKDENTEDVITFIKRYADRIICFCRRSTWGTSTATINSIDEPTLGEKIFIVPHVSFVSNIGLVKVDSLQDIGVGQSIMITSEPGVRTFDGVQYSETNYAYKKVMKYIEHLANFVCSSYDARGGYIVYGTMQETTPEANRINPETGFALRFAVQESQGRGWTIYSGADMAWPMPYTQGLLIQNAGGYLVQALLDGRSGKWQNISTYQGPEGSGLTRVWTDKDNAEIICGVLWNEDRGPSESFQLEFLENHVFLRPIDDAIAPTQDPAYRALFQVIARCYLSGGIVALGESKNIPIPGDIVFDRKQQGPRIQLEHEFTASQFRLLSSDRYYANRDRAGLQSLAQRTTPDSLDQTEYVQQLLWITRGRNPILNRVTGISGTGGYLARIAGPDGISDSALEFDGTAHISTPIQSSLTGDFTIQFGFKG